MGGCASKPKDLDSQEAPAPVEKPGIPDKAESEAVPQENNNEGEIKKEEPLVDLSEPATEAPKVEEVAAETKTATTEIVPEDAKVETAEQAKEPTEEKKEVAADVPKEPGKEVAGPKAEEKTDAPAS